MDLARAAPRRGQAAGSAGTTSSPEVRLRNLPIPRRLGRHSPSFCRGGTRPRLLIATSRCPHECRPNIVVVLCLWRRSLRRMTPTFAQRFVEDLDLQPSPGQWLQTQLGFFCSCFSFHGLEPSSSDRTCGFSRKEGDCHAAAVRGEICLQGITLISSP